jgi:hypothetical protein
MPWVKLDEQFRHHPKIVRAGPIGISMYVCGLSYAAEYLTDGIIPRQAVRTLLDLDGVVFVGMKDNETIDPIVVADTLVELGLWDKVPDGYRIHDYLDYNPSKAQVVADRAAKAAAGRAGGIAAAKARATADGEAEGEADAVAESKPVTVSVPVSDSGSTTASESRNPEPSTPPTPPQAGGQPSRANGTNPRSQWERAEAAREEERRQLREARREIHFRYLRGEISEAEEQRLYDDLGKQPDDLTRVSV